VRLRSPLSKAGPAQQGRTTLSLIIQVTLPLSPLSFFFSAKSMVGRTGPPPSRQTPNGVGLDVHLQLVGTLQGGLPNARISAWSLTSPGEGSNVRERIFYEGPLFKILAADELALAARAIVHAYYSGDPQNLDAAAEVLRTLLGWETFAPHEEPCADCSPDRRPAPRSRLGYSPPRQTAADLVSSPDCDCGGWDIFNADPEAGYLGEIQRCDTCDQLPDDETAAELARAQGFVVTLRDNRFEVDAHPTADPR